MFILSGASHLKMSSILQNKDETKDTIQILIVQWLQNSRYFYVTYS